MTWTPAAGTIPTVEEFAEFLQDAQAPKQVQVFMVRAYQQGLYRAEDSRQQQALLEHIKEIGYGELTIRIHNGQPQMSVAGIQNRKYDGKGG